MSAISIRNVRKTYAKSEAVKGVDLDIAAGEFVVILGPSGCGKSTLLRMIAGLEAITSGEISIGGRVVNDLEPRARGCAMVFQNYALYPHMSVAENIGYALKVAGVGRAERQERVRRTAESVGLGDLLARKPGELSGGQRQRVAMGRAMIREPKVFLFDEPLSNLDATLRVQMRLEIRRLHRRLGTTSVFVTHDQVEAMTLADRLVVMNAGVIEQVGTPKDVYANPKSRFTGGFIGAPPMNFVPVTIARPGLAVTGQGAAIAYDEAVLHAATGQKVLAGIRPETVSILAARRPGSLELPVEFVEELGAGTLYHTRFEGAAFIIAAGDHSISTAASLHVQIPAAGVHLFDPENGRRLPAPARANAAARDAA